MIRVINLYDGCYYVTVNGCKHIFHPREDINKFIVSQFTNNPK